jgi:hypothetical protein
MRRGVCSPRGRARYTAPTPPFSSAWQIVRGMDSAFKTPPTSPPRHPFGGVSSKGYFPQSSSASRLTAGALGFLTFTQCAEGPAQRDVCLWPKADILIAWANVRFGSKADVTLLNFDVRFTPESRHRSARWQCPLWAITGHPTCQSRIRRAAQRSGLIVTRPILSGLHHSYARI